MRLKSLFPALLFVLFVSYGLFGCALTPPNVQLPATEPHLALKVVEKKPGLNDLPIGGYTIPDSQVVITKPRKISMVESAFGAMGVLSAHSSGKSAGKSMIAGVEDTLGVSLKAFAENAVSFAAAKAGVARTWSLTTDSAKPAQIELTPMTYLAPDEKGTGRLILFMKAKYHGAKNWSSRYVYVHDEERPIKGEASWTSGSGQPYKEALQKGYTILAEVMIKDADRNAAGWMSEPAKIRSPYFGDVPFEITGNILQKTDDTLIFNTEGGGLVHGINVLPMNNVEFLPLDKKE